MSGDEINRDVCEVVNRLVPVTKARILRAMERSREDVEFEIATLANLLTINTELCGSGVTERGSNEAG
jgi:hypothetical protein